MIHECLDFILKPLKKAAEVGIMMSDPVGSCRYVFTPLAAYIVDVQEALALSGVAGKTSHITMATYKSFGDPFQHEPQTASTTLAHLHAVEETVDPWDLASYVKAASGHQLNGIHCPFWHDDESVSRYARANKNKCKCAGVFDHQELSTNTTISVVRALGQSVGSVWRGTSRHERNYGGTTNGKLVADTISTCCECNRMDRIKNGERKRERVVDGK